MFSRRRGGWMNFEARNRSAKVVRFATTCISTSAESAGHFVTVRSTGKIASMNDNVKVSPQTVRDGAAQGRRSGR